MNFNFLVCVKGRAYRYINKKTTRMAKILIIEDEKAIRNVLSNIVIEEDKNHEVDTAENGLDGFRNAYSEYLRFGPL